MPLSDVFLCAPPPPLDALFVNIVCLSYKQPPVIFHFSYLCFIGTLNLGVLSPFRLRFCLTQIRRNLFPKMCLLIIDKTVQSATYKYTYYVFELLFNTGNFL